jgi:flagellar protein FliL
MTGNPKLDKILLGVNGLVAIGAAALVFYSHTKIKPLPTDQVGEEKALEATAATDNQITPVMFKKMVVNIHTEGTRLRYLEAEIGLLPFAESDKEGLKKAEYLLQDALIDIAGKMTPDELSSVTGKILLEGRLKKRLNEKLEATVIKQIYFTKFIVQ